MSPPLRHGARVAPAKMMELHRLTADKEPNLLKEGRDCVSRDVRHLHFSLPSIWKLQENGLSLFSHLLGLSV